MKQNVVAIDGPAASGKSSVAHALAEKTGGVFISTGSMYRAAALKALRAGVEIADTPQLAVLMAETEMRFPETDVLEMDNVIIPDSDLRNPKTAAAASKIATISSVRKRLVELQRKMISPVKTLVMEGRDIGTVVFPEAKYKFYLTATPETRAKRRLLQDGGTVSEAEIKRIAADIAERDHRDMTRADSPLKQADDAVFLDNSALDLNGTLQFMLKTMEAKK